MVPLGLSLKKRSVDWWRTFNAPSVEAFTATLFRDRYRKIASVLHIAPLVGDEQLLGATRGKQLST